MGSSHDDAQLHLALTLLHFLWLACVPAALLHLAARLLPTRFVELRYRISVLSLALLLPMFVIAMRMAKDQEAFVSQQPTAFARDASMQSTHGVLQYQPNTQVVPGQEIVASPLVDQSVVEAASARSINMSQGDHVGGIPWARAITMLYFLGVIVFSLRLLKGYIAGRRLRRAAKPMTESEFQQLAVRLADRIRLKTTPTIYWCESVVVPAVVGVLRPAVLLPTAVANGLTIEQLEHILLHEFTHLRRLDPIVNFLQNVLETLFFYHPLVWWISSQVRLYRELSCDDAVVACGVNPRQYADTLIDIAMRSRNSDIRNLSSVSSVASRPQLRTRLARLLGHSHQPQRWPSRLADGMSLIVVLGIVAVLVTSTLSETLAVPQQVDDTIVQSERPVVADAILKNLPSSIEPTELSGIVVDEHGKPLSGVTVDAWSWHTGDETTTDENGVFRFRPSSDEGRRKVEIRWAKSGYAPHYVAQQPVGVKDLVIMLNDKTFIEGRVIAVDGSPAAGVTIRGAQKNIQGDGVMISEVVTEAVTDGSGNYRMYVFPDAYELTVASAAGVSRLASVIVPRRQLVQRDIQLEPGVRFEAVVNDATSGKPFAGLVLSSFMQSQFRGTSDADGRIVIENMLPGASEFNVGAGEPLDYKGITYFGNGPLGRWWSPSAKTEFERLEKTAGEFQRNLDALSFDLKPGMAPVQILVEQGVEFSGHVYDPDGKPRAGATVAPAKTGSGNSLTGDTRYSVKTGADGSYKVIMPAGNDFQYNLMAFDGEYGKWRTWGAVARDPLPTRPGQKVTDYDFQLTRGATVRGKVLLKDEAGTVARQVRAHPADLRGNRYYDPTVDVQADGSFELRGLRPGKHFIQVSPFWLSAKDSPDGNSVTIEVADGEIEEGIELKPANPEQAFVPSAKKQQPVDVPAVASTIAATAGGVIFKAENKIFSTPCFDESFMYFGACDGFFYCLDKVTGKLKWRLGDLERVDASPVLHKGLVFFTSFAKQATWLHAVHADTGKMAWAQQIAGVGNSNPLMHEGKLLIAGQKELLCLDPQDGKTLARYDNACDFPGSIAAHGNRIVSIQNNDYEANNYQGLGTLACFDQNTQAVAWKLPLGAGSFGKLHCDNRNCYFGTRDGKFTAVDLATGTVLWKTDCTAIFVNKEPIWPDGDVIDNATSLVITCFQQSLQDPGAMICIDKSKGDIVWSVMNALKFSTSNGLTDDSIVTVTLDHKVMQIDRESGKVRFQGFLPNVNLKWQAETYHLTLDAGHAFIVGADQQVWRLDLSGLK